MMSIIDRKTTTLIVSACALLHLTASGVGVLAGGTYPDFWVRWDAPHYLRIATEGYVPLNFAATGDHGLFIVFLPMFPAIVAAATLIVSNVVVAALVVNFLLTVTVCLLLFALTAEDFGRAAASRAVALLLTFPTAFFLFAPYTEALFLTVSMAALLAVRRSKWWTASIAGAMCSATRLTGIALIAAFAARAISRSDKQWRPWIPVLVAPIGFGGYLLINFFVNNDPFFFAEVQRFHWGQGPALSWKPIVDGIRGLVDGTRPDPYPLIYWGRTLAIVVGVGALIVGATRVAHSKISLLRPAEWVFAAVSLLVTASASWLISMPRYLMSIFPIFILGARSRRLWIVVCPLGIALQLFLMSRYARGIWAY